MSFCINLNATKLFGIRSLRHPNIWILNLTFVAAHKADHSTCRLFLPAMRLNYGKRNLCYRGTVIWNSFPTALTEAESLHDFKLEFLAML